MYKKISRGFCASELLLSAARYGSAPRPPRTALTSFKKRTYIRDNTVRTPSSLLLLLAKLTGSTGSFPLLARAEPAENASLTEPAEGVYADPAENASLVENAPVEAAETAPTEASEIAPAEPAVPAETHPETAEEEWAAVRG